MKHRTPQIEIDILGEAVADIAECLANGFTGGYGFAIEKMRYQDAVNGFVRTDPGRWTGLNVEDSAIRMRVSRAYEALERRGLIERVDMGSGRCTHIAPTEAGKALVAEMDRERNITDECSISVWPRGPSASEGPTGAAMAEPWAGTAIVHVPQVQCPRCHSAELVRVRHSRAPTATLSGCTFARNVHGVRDGALTNFSPWGNVTSLFPMTPIKNFEDNQMQTFLGKVRFDGVAAPGSAVEIREGDEVLATTTADDDGSWEVDLVELPVGRHRIHAIAGGNQSRSINVEITGAADSQPPVEADDDDPEVQAHRAESLEYLNDYFPGQRDWPSCDDEADDD